MCQMFWDQSTPSLDQQMLKGLMMLSSGTQLPYDAGKWVTCQSHKELKYHLITLNGTMPGGFSTEMEYGLCIPANCTKKEAGEFALKDSRLFQLAGMYMTPALNMLTATELVVNPKNNIYGVWNVDDLQGPGVGTWITVAFCALLLLLIIVSTGLHCAANNRRNRVQPPESNQLLEQGGEAAAPRPGMENHILFRAFSLVGPDGTWDKLFSCPAYKPTDCLNGARALSMFWVVCGHSFLMSEAIAGYTNRQDIAQSPINHDAAENNWFFMFILNAQMSVDTFFYMGGFLFSLLTVKDLQKTRGKFMHFQALVLRYLRLTPSLAFVMVVYYQIWPYFAHGPFAPRFQNSVFRRCDKSWWSELTYTLNFIPFNSDDVCMGWTWYLGDDMIFFIFGILILPIYYKWRAVGWSIVGILSAASLSYTGYLCFKYHMAPEALDYHYAEYSLHAYSKPYTRIPTYFVGIVAAWILLNMEERGVTRETGWVGPVTATVLSILAWGTLSFLTFIPSTDHGYHKNSWSDQGDFLGFIYLTFSRPLWGICWALVTYLCYYGHAPMIDALLSHRFWTPFARLTYGAYLCHPLVIKLAAGCAVNYYTFSGMDLMYRITGNIVMAYSCSFVVWCTVERPMMTFTTAMIKSKKKGSDKKSERPHVEDAQATKPATGK